MEILLSTLAGFALGVVVNWFFWGALRWQRPKVLIAPKIAVDRNQIAEPRTYRFKIFNDGRNQVIDITFKAWIVTVAQRPGGTVSKAVHELPTHNSTTLTLSPANEADPPWGLCPEVYLRTTPSFAIEEILKDNPDYRVLVTLRASDAVSGTTVVQQRTFSAADIVKGEFHVGRSFEIW